MKIHSIWSYCQNFLLLVFVLLFYIPSISSADNYSYSNIDNGACSFPFSFTFTGSIDSNSTGNGMIIYPGNYSYTLKNLNTGYAVTSSGAAPSIVNGNYLTLLGDNPQYSPNSQWCGWPNCSGGIWDQAYPVQILHGKTIIDLSSNLIMSRNGSTDMVNPCQILTPKNYVAPAPRSIVAPWTIPSVDVVSGMQRAGVYPNDYNLPAVPNGHTHSHLDIFINGQSVVVPAGIGMVEPVELFSNFFYSPVETARIHTHNTTGIIHLENDSPPFQSYTLGQLFDIWQVKFNQNQIGAYCTVSQQDDPNCLPDRKTLNVYINGNLYTGDPRQVIMNNLYEIAIVYGAAPSSGIPNCYSWPPNYYGNLPNGTPGVCPHP